VKSLLQVLTTELHTSGGTKQKNIQACIIADII